jgi:hypothetical protein
MAALGIWDAVRKFAADVCFWLAVVLNIPKYLMTAMSEHLPLIFDSKDAIADISIFRFYNFWADWVSKSVL